MSAGTTNKGEGSERSGVSSALFWKLKGVTLFVGESALIKEIYG